MLDGERFMQVQFDVSCERVNHRTKVTSASTNSPAEESQSVAGF